MRRAGLAGLWVLAGVCALAQAPSPKPRVVPSHKTLAIPPLKPVTVPKPESFTLSNGMKVFLLAHHELPVISGFALVRTGNLFDPPDKRGLAEITGSVLRSGGTRNRSGDEMDELLENMAASVESSISESRGSVTFSCLKENAPEVMAIFRAFLTEAEFRQDKLDLAKTQLHSAIARRNDDPGGIAGREFANIIYGRDNPFGWTVEHEHVQRIGRDDLVAFYKRYFFPANITLAVYGDFETATMKAELEKLFGGWTYQQPPVPAFPEWKNAAAPGIYVADREDVPQTFLKIGHSGGLLRDQDYPALQVAASILGGGFTSRLVHRVRTQLGYAYDIGAGWGAGYLTPGLFEISGGTKSQTTVETIEAVREELNKLRSGEVTAAELKTARDAVLNSFVFFFDTPSKTLNRMVSYDYYGYPPDFIFQYQKAVEGVTRADVLRVAKEYLIPEKLTIVAVGDVKQMVRPLSSLGMPVRPLDLSIPELKPEAEGPTQP
jgi:zinc protease